MADKIRERLNKKFRIQEVLKGDGKTYYRPQFKFMFFWHDMYPDTMDNPTKDWAERVIAKEIDAIVVSKRVC